jgi:dTDP-4-amino-4,6-dideoxygalactose transaminase
MPSYTFVSTANAFVLRGAKIIFADSLPDHPNIDPSTLESLITSKTKAIVVVHYGGIACDMDNILKIASKHNLKVIEDAAHSVDATYKGRYLGTIGDYGAFSFHETKNIVCGEGGLLVVNDKSQIPRAEILREKGTNRSAFFRGEIDKYGWVDVGSSFLSSEILAAFLFAQLEMISEIQEKRIAIWKRYSEGLNELADSGYGLPIIPEYASNNAHLFYIICSNLKQRTNLIAHLNAHGIKAVFHYQPLHESKYYKQIHPSTPNLPNSVKFGDTLVRLPLFAGLEIADQNFIIEKVLEYVRK